MPFLLAINIRMSYIYEGYTLVDITPTGQTKYLKERALERNQQRNWETVVQAISLRTQPTILETNILKEDISYFNNNFGINYRGPQQVWHFKFAVDNDDIFRKDGDRYGLLKFDFRTTPIILNLTETVQPEKPIFYTSGPWKNIYFNSLVE